MWNSQFTKSSEQVAAPPRSERESAYNGPSVKIVRLHDQFIEAAYRHKPVKKELVAGVGVEPVLEDDLLGQQHRTVLLVEPPQLLSEMKCRRF